MLSFIIHIALAIFLGMCIGLERQFRQRATGLRTNTLVALGAAIFMLIASRIGGDASGRIASYIISGIGFLGAGVILKDGGSIRGLNTAATLWCTAAIGAFCGLGYVYEPLIGTAFIIGIHVLLRPISNKIMKAYMMGMNSQSLCRILIIVFAILAGILVTILGILSWISLIIAYTRGSLPIIDIERFLQL